MHLVSLSPTLAVFFKTGTSCFCSERAFAKRALETINAASFAKTRQQLNTETVNTVATPMNNGRVTNPMTGPVRAFLGSEASVAQLGAALEAASQ